MFPGSRFQMERRFAGQHVESPLHFPESQTARENEKSDDIANRPPARLAAQHNATGVPWQGQRGDDANIPAEVEGMGRSAAFPGHWFVGRKSASLGHLAPSHAARLPAP